MPRLHAPHRTITIALLIASVPATAQTDLLEFVLERQSAARARFEDAALLSHEQFVANSRGADGAERIERDTTTTRVVQGANVRIESRQTFDETYGSENRSGVQDRYVVRNDSYVARWGARNGKSAIDLSIFEHSSPYELNPGISRGFHYEGGFNILDFAYELNTIADSGSQNIRAKIDRLRNHGEFSAERKLVDGVEIIEIAFTQKGAQTLTAMVDPNKGYATTQLIYDYSEIAREGFGRRTDYTIEMKELEEGIWVPAKLSCEFEIKNPGYGEKGTVDIELETVEFDPNYPPEQFTWESLGYPGGYAHVHDIAGESHLMVAEAGGIRPHSTRPRETELETATRLALYDIKESLRERNESQTTPEVPATTTQSPEADSGKTPADEARPEVPAENRSRSIILIVVTAVVLLAAGILVTRRN